MMTMYDGVVMYGDALWYTITGYVL